jgi:hypothetical protein
MNVSRSSGSAVRATWLPHLAIRIAETRERAQALDVEERQRRTVEYLCLIKKWCSIRNLGAVKAAPYVRAIAEWFLV